MAIYYVSKNYRHDDDRDIIITPDNAPDLIYDLPETKILIYEDRVKTWFFDIVKQFLTDRQHNYPGDYVAMMTVLAHVEAIEQFRTGEKPNRHNTKEWLTNSASRIFPDQQYIVYESLWKEARCGLFHLGFIDGKIYLTRDQDQVFHSDENEGKLFIHPEKFIHAIENDFNTYIKQLNSKEEGVLRKNFEKSWDELWKNS